MMRKGEFGKKGLNEASAATQAVIILLSLIAIASVDASALGVSPAQNTLNYEPGTSVELEFQSINSDNADLNVVLSATGSLQESIFFPEGKLILRKDSPAPKFRAVIRMPDKLGPGVHLTFIKMTPVMPNREGTLVAFTTLQIPVRVRVPYPSKYADVRIAAMKVDEGTQMPINLEFDNLGTEDIRSAKGDIDVFAAGKESAEPILKMACPPISVVSNSYSKSECEPRKAFEKGQYRAEARAEYDGAQRTASLNFTVGEPKIAVTLNTAEITPGAINEVSFTATNDWNTALEVNGFVEVAGQQSEMPRFTLGPGEKKDVSGFFDARELGGLKQRQGNLTIILGYAGMVKSERFTITIMEGEAKEAPGRTTVILTGVAIAIALIIIMLVFFLRKRKGEGGEEPKGDKSGSQSQSLY